MDRAEGGSELGNHWPTGRRSKRDRANWDTMEGRDRQTDEPTKRELFGQLKGDRLAAVTCSRRTVPERRTGAS